MKAEGQEVLSSAPPTTLHSASLDKAKGHSGKWPLALVKDRATLPEAEAAGAFTSTRAWLQGGERSSLRCGKGGKLLTAENLSG